jgi:hypothetical protein
VRLLAGYKGGVSMKSVRCHFSFISGAGQVDTLIYMIFRRIGTKNLKKNDYLSKGELIFATIFVRVLSLHVMA